jgi:uncharacterized protein
MLKTKRDTAIYDLLEEQASVATKTAQAFVTMAHDFGNLKAHADIMDKLEDEGDRLTHELQARIATMFITPLDKEDLRELSSSLDDVTDLIEAAGARAELYRLTGPRPELISMGKLLVEIAELTEDAVKELRNGFAKSQKLRDTLKEIHTVENQCDREFRNALRNLFDEPGIDPLTVIKWKEMFDRIENATDKCESIAAIIGTIIDKYA